MQLDADKFRHDVKRNLDELIGVARLYEALWLVDHNLLDAVDACRLLYGSNELSVEEAGNRIAGVQEGIIKRRSRAEVPPEMRPSAGFQAKFHPQT